LEQGYELPVISAMLGHSSINTTYEYYTDVIEGNTEILTCLNELYAMDDGEVED
jgi:site-specific recombinase XerD